MPLRCVGVRSLLALGVALVLPCASAMAQRHFPTATIAVSLRVLPQASFDGGPEHPFAAAIVPGEPLRVAPAAGVRTRMTYNAPTKVVVSGTPLIGPGGATVQVRFLCAFGDGLSVSASEPFDCVGGHVAGLEGGRTTIPLAVGAELSGLETLRVPPGTYTGRVTLTATHPVY